MAAVQAELEQHKQLVPDLCDRIEELAEELATGREANRILMAELTRS